MKQEQANILTPQPGPLGVPEWAQINQQIGAALPEASIYQKFAAATQAGYDDSITKSLIASMAEQGKINSPEYYTEKYPDAPQGLFTESMSETKARFLYERVASQSRLEAFHQSTGDGTLARLGYGFVGGMLGDPMSTMAYMYAPRLMHAALKATPAWKTLAQSYANSSKVGQVLASDVVEELTANMAYYYTARKGTENFTGIKYTAEDAALESMFGMLSSGAIRGIGHFLQKSLAKTLKTEKDVKLFEQHLENEQLPPALPDEFNPPPVPSPGLPKRIVDLSDASYSEKLLYHAYNSGFTGQRSTMAQIQNSLGDNVAYGGHFNNSIFISPELTFGNSIYVNRDQGIIKNTANFLNQQTQVFEVNLNEFKLLDGKQTLKEFGSLNERTSDIATEIKNAYEALGIEIADDATVSDVLKKLLPMIDSRDIELRIQELLEIEGYQGIIFKADSLEPNARYSDEVDMGLDKEAIMLFKYAYNAAISKFDTDFMPGNAGILGMDTSSTQKKLSQSSGPWQGGKRGRLEGEGHMSNGKVITIDRDGYVSTDPIYGNDDVFRQGYVEMFSLEHQQQIKETIDRFNNSKRVYKEFPALTKQMVDRLKEAEMAAQYDSFADNYDKSTQVLSSLTAHRFMEPDELKANLKAIGIVNDMEAAEFINDLEFLATESEKMRQELLTTEVENKNKDFRARVDDTLRKAEVYKKVKEAHARMEKILNRKNIDIGKAMDAELRFFETAEKLSKNDPELTEIVMKAMEDCLRRNT